MILVTLGTQNNNFERLLKEIEKCIDKRIINEEVIVQAGSTKYSSDKMKIYDFLSPDDITKLLKEASFVITHGGVGSIVTALNENKKVIAVPRKQKYKEHVNDHQAQIIKKFNDQGCIIGLEDVSKLSEGIDKVKNFSPKKYESNNKNFISLIENYIDNN